MTEKIEKPKVGPKPDLIDETTGNELGIKVNEIIAQNPGIDISVTAIDANTSTSYNFGIQDNFAGASTTKVLTAAAFLHQVEEGTHSLNEALGSSTAQQQIKQMINRSNNDSWALLNKAVGYANLEAYAKSIGASSYQWSGNIITAGDEALILKKLYKRELINEEHTSLVLSYMQNTNNEDMIPVVVPAGATFYHKYGQLEDRLHDAAIIDFKDQPIILVIYTKGGAADGSNYQTRIALVQSLAQTVFQTVYKV